MSSRPLEIESVGTFGVIRLAADAAIPVWADGPGFRCVARSADELSIVAPSEAIPTDVAAQGPFAGFRVRGTLDFAAVGILARLTTSLAEHGIPVFVVSTYDTDYLLVPAAMAAAAARAWRLAGVERCGEWVAEPRP